MIRAFYGMALVALFTASTAWAAPVPPKKEIPGARRLTDISINGVIEGPRVFFITARSHPRYRDGLHRRYLPSALAVSQEASRPPALSVRDGKAPQAGGTQP